MSGPDWCRWYPTRWLGGVLHLTNEQRGVYIQVINVILDLGECSADRGYLGRLCRLNRQRVDRVINELINTGKLYESSGKLRQNRAETERKLAIKLAESGADLASKRWGAKDLADAALQCQPHKKKSLPPSSTEDSLNLPSKKTPLGGDDHTTQKSEDRGTRLSEDWRPSEAAIDHCRVELGASAEIINREYPSFMDWGLAATGSVSRKRNWDRAFINWIRRVMNGIREQEARERRWAEQRRN